MSNTTLRNPQWGNEAFALRYKQVDSLRQYFPTLKELTKDSLYEIVITLPSRKVINLRIILGQEFPYQAPTLQITPPVQYRFVNDQMYILPQMHEKLASWNLHTNLGKTVYEITQKLIQEQPNVLSGQPAPSTMSYSGGYPNTSEPPPPYGMYGNMPPGPVRPMAISLTPQQVAPTSTPPAPSHQIRTPAIPSSFPELEQKSTAELTELMSNEDQFQALFDALDVVKTMRQLRDDLRDGNEELAKKNVERTAAVDGLHQQLNTKKDTLTQLRAAVVAAATRQQAILQMLEPAVLADRLSEAAQAADMESEEIAQAFLDGSGGDYREFIKKFTEKRKTYHLRAAKKEGLIMTLNQKR